MSVQITVDNIPFDVLADHYAKHGFKALPATPTMSAIEIVVLRDQAPEYWVIELGDGDAHLRVWGSPAYSKVSHLGELLSPSQAIILKDGMRFATIPPCGI